MLIADATAEVVGAIAVAVVGFIIAYFVREPLVRRRQLRDEVCDLLRRLDDAEPHEDHAADLGRITARRRALGALSGNGDARRRREKAEAVAELLNGSIKECPRLALRTKGSKAKGLRDLEAKLQRFTDSWGQVRDQAESTESASGGGRQRPMTTKEKLTKADARVTAARERLDEAREECGRARERLHSEMQALGKVWCR